ncbi:MAG: hypothetical protein Q9168_002756 [Polycauliona sp. 1 TL-2023]
MQAPSRTQTQTQTEAAAPQNFLQKLKALYDQGTPPEEVKEDLYVDVYESFWGRPDSVGHVPDDMIQDIPSSILDKAKHHLKQWKEQNPAPEQEASYNPADYDKGLEDDDGKDDVEHDGDEHDQKDVEHMKEGGDPSWHREFENFPTSFDFDEKCEFLYSRMADAAKDMIFVRKEYLRAASLIMAGDGRKLWIVTGQERLGKSVFETYLICRLLRNKSPFVHLVNTIEGYTYTLYCEYGVRRISHAAMSGLLDDEDFGCLYVVADAKTTSDNVGIPFIEEARTGTWFNNALLFNPVPGKKPSLLYMTMDQSLGQFGLSNAIPARLKLRFLIHGKRYPYREKNYLGRDAWSGIVRVDLLSSSLRKALDAWIVSSSSLDKLRLFEEIRSISALKGLTETLFKTLCVADWRNGAEKLELEFYYPIGPGTGKPQNKQAIFYTKSHEWFSIQWSNEEGIRGHHLEHLKPSTLYYEEDLFADLPLADVCVIIMTQKVCYIFQATTAKEYSLSWTMFQDVLKCLQAANQRRKRPRSKLPQIEYILFTMDHDCRDPEDTLPGDQSREMIAEAEGKGITLEFFGARRTPRAGVGRIC